MPISKPSRTEELIPITPVEKEVTIEVGGKDYPLPHLKFGAYKKMLKLMESGLEKEMNELENMEFVIDFYLQLLKPDNPELTKKSFDDFLIYQCSAEFLVRVKLALYRVPLDSR